MHIGPKMEIRVVTLGLDGAGKTTILFKLKQDEFMQPIPTIGKPLSLLCVTGHVTFQLPAQTFAFLPFTSMSGVDPSPKSKAIIVNKS